MPSRRVNFYPYIKIPVFKTQQTKAAVRTSILAIWRALHTLS